MGARIHAQGAADAAGNAAIEGEPVNAGLCGGARELHVGNRCAAADSAPFENFDLAERLAGELHDDARHAPVAHDHVGAEPHRRHGNVGGEILQEIDEILLVCGREQRLRGTADAKPRVGRKRRLARQPPAQARRQRAQAGDEIRPAHGASSASSPGNCAAHRVMSPAPRQTT